MFRVNGLFGWIEANDRRSLALFAGFVVVFQVGAVLVLYLPLAAFDPGHAPVFAWAGYAARYLPLVTLAAACVFAGLMLWHTHAMRRLVAFRFVDDGDEPRLCRIVEPLAIGMGLPCPYVGVIPSPALNAFACGIRRKDAVVVVTRGLLDGLDDDELAAVVAHELAHIRNGDIRLMAAANVCLTMLGWLVAPRLRRTGRIQEIVGLPIAAVLMPPLLALAVMMSFMAQTSLKAGRLVRLLISSAREFVADAAAIEATQNPAALVSALGKIEGRSRMAGLPAAADAMMIDGPVAGMLATHPPMAARVEAITAVTGSMALIAPGRRDTRDPAQRAAAEAAARGDIAGIAPTEGRGRRPGALSRLGVDDGRNWLGLTRDMTIGLVLALVALVALNVREGRGPGALVAALDPRPASELLLVVGRGVACSVGAISPLRDRFSFDEMCRLGSMDAFASDHLERLGPIGVMFRATTRDQFDTFALRSGERGGEAPSRGARPVRSDPRGPDAK